MVALCLGKEPGALGALQRSHELWGLGQEVTSFGANQKATSFAATPQPVASAV